LKDWDKDKTGLIRVPKERLTEDIKVYLDSDDEQLFFMPSEPQIYLHDSIIYKVTSIGDTSNIYKDFSKSDLKEVSKWKMFGK